MAGWSLSSGGSEPAPAKAGGPTRGPAMTMRHEARPEMIRLFPVGALVCVAWTVLLASYRKLNPAKFAVLTEIEADLAFPVFTRERDAYRRDRHRSLSTIESLIPGCFVLLCAAMLIAAIIARGS
jgi:hypothetical protein